MTPFRCSLPFLLIVVICLIVLPAVAGAGQVAAPLINSEPLPSVTGYFDDLKSERLALTATNQTELHKSSFDIRSDQPGQVNTGRKDIKKAFLLSLLVPGAGQLYVGSKTKAALFFGIEALTLTGHIVYHNKGEDKTDIFNAYADTYWSESRYSDWLEINWGEREDDSIYRIPGDPSSGSLFTHTLPSTKTQQYYEMIGKYNQFVFGWADIEPLTAPDPNSAEHQYSPLRLHYEDMRGDANHMYDVAKTSLIVLMVNHVISSFEAAWSAKRYNENATDLTGLFSMRASMVTTEVDRYPMLTMTYKF